MFLTLNSFLQLKADYIQLLKETDIDSRSRWSETKKKIDSDPRYKAIDSSSRREDWFRDYVKTLEDVSIKCIMTPVTVVVVGNSCILLFRFDLIQIISIFL